MAILKKEKCERTFEPHCGMFQGLYNGDYEEVLTARWHICECGKNVMEHKLVCHEHFPGCFEEISRETPTFFQRLLGRPVVVLYKLIKLK